MILMPFFSTAGCYEPDTVTCLSGVENVTFEWDITCKLVDECYCSEDSDVAK